MDIVSSSITHVEQDEQGFRTIIFFRYQNRPFFLSVDKQHMLYEEGYLVGNVYHDNTENRNEVPVKSCPFCGNPDSRGYCPELSKMNRTLFNELKEKNNIRLYWLYQNVFPW